jgi:hypothetical protein
MSKQRQMTGGGHHVKQDASHFDLTVEAHQLESRLGGAKQNGEG